MTYCVAISTHEGLVFCSDSRTNAGPDMLSLYSKMHIFQPQPDRLFVVLTAGNLATTQAIVTRLTEELSNSESTNLASVKSMQEAARYVSNVSREVQTAEQASVAASNIDTSASLILGGQIQGGAPANFLIYAAGNFITDSDATPFLQIGESKYGKPILDRILDRKTNLEDAARCAIVSMDSTIKSNATVGPPIEILVYKKDSFDASYYIKLNENDEYLQSVKKIWHQAMLAGFSQLPRFDWEGFGVAESP